MKLHTFHQSGSAYRVRIALNLKGLSYEPVFVRGGRGSVELKSTEFLKINPLGAVPVLEDGALVMSQSVAIMEYLEDQYPMPSLLPTSAAARHRVRLLVQVITSDTHPLATARVIDFMEQRLGIQEQQSQIWTRHWILSGLSAFESLLSRSIDTGKFCHGDQPTMADACLIPQVFTALRFGCDLSGLPNILRINERCLAHPSFLAAAPERQPDAPNDLQGLGPQT